MGWEREFLKAFEAGVKAAIKYFKGPGGRKELAKAAEQVQKSLGPTVKDAAKEIIKTTTKKG
jgi:hypothetical protein